MRNLLLPPGVNPIAVKKYVIIVVRSLYFFENPLRDYCNIVTGVNKILLRVYREGVGHFKTEERRGTCV